VYFIKKDGESNLLGWLGPTIAAVIDLHPSNLIQVRVWIRVMCGCRGFGLEYGQKLPYNLFMYCHIGKQVAYPWFGGV
jgi:hypothetical protein